MKSYLNSKLLLFNKILPNKKTIITDRSLKEFKKIKKNFKKRELNLIDVTSINERINKDRKLGLNEFQSKNLSMAIAAAKISKLKEKKFLNV